MSDLALWIEGYNVAQARSRYTNTPWELDFLRGMHQNSALDYLAKVLAYNTKKNIRLMSIWMDKHAWITINNNNSPQKKQELADLAIIVRKIENGELNKWMWLVQGKRTKKLLDAYTGRSSKVELELMQEMPSFILLSSQNTFDLKKDFPSGCKTIPWTFLDFDKQISSNQSAYKNGYSPIAPRWLGATPSAGTWANTWQSNNGNPPYPVNCISSYTECLTSIIQQNVPKWIDPTSTNYANITIPTFIPGASVDGMRPGSNKLYYPEWRKLYQDLIYKASSSTIGHARTNANRHGSVLQRSKFLQEHFLHFYKHHDLYHYERYERYNALRHGMDYAIGLYGKESYDVMDTKISKFNKCIDLDSGGNESIPPNDFEGDENLGDGGINTLFIDVLDDYSKEIKD